MVLRSEIRRYPSVAGPIRGLFVASAFCFLAGGARIKIVRVQFCSCDFQFHRCESVFLAYAQVFLKERLGAQMEIVLVGLNHRTAPVEVREKVSFTSEQSLRAA